MASPASPRPPRLAPVSSVLLGVLMCLAALLSAGPAQAAPLDLMQAYEAARQYDPGLRGARAELDVGREHEVLARSALLPSVSGFYTTSRNQADVTQAGGSTEQRSYKGYNASLQLRQALFHPEGQAAYRMGQARTSASKARFAAQEQELIIRLFEAYATVLVQQEQLGLAQAQLTSLTEQHKANERLLAKGEGTRTEVLETLAKLNGARAQVIETSDLVDTARNRLSSLTGVPATGLAGLSPGFDSPDNTLPPMAELVDMVQRHHPLLRELRQELDAVREEVRRAEAGHLPRVDLLVNAGQAESDSITSFRQKTHSTSVSLQVSVPLYTGGAVQAQARQALGRQAVVQAELDARTADLLVELQRQHQLHHSSGLRLVALGHAVASARLLVEATRKSVSGGVRTNLDVLDAQERLTQTLRDLAQTRYAHLQAGLRARSAAGILSEADLRRVAARFAGAP